MSEKPRRSTFRERLDHMTRTLREEITAGKRKSGTFLPSIPQLAEQFHLSVNSVQKGLDRLAEENLIERIPRVGIRVKETAASITLGYYPSLIQEADLNTLIAKFHEKFPSIHVKMLPLQYINYHEVTNYYLQNELIDVITINHTNYLEFALTNQDLSDLFEPLEADEGVDPFLRRPFQQARNLYVKPITYSPVVLCYNQKHFAEKDVPEPEAGWTWKDFMACLEKLEQPEGTKLAFYFYPSTMNRWPIFLLQSGADFKKNKNWAQGPIVESIQTVHDIIHRQNTFSLLLSENDFNVEKRFAQGDISIMMTSYFNLNQLRDTDLVFDLAPLPYVNVPKTLLLIIGLALNRRSQRKEAARTFIDFMTSYEAQLHIRQHTFSIPALRQASEWDGEITGYRPPRFNLYRELESSYGLLTDLHLHPKEVEPLLAVMNLYWMGIISKDEMMARLKKLQRHN